MEETVSLSEYMAKNSSMGSLKVQAFQAEGVIPIEGMDVVIYKDFSDGRWVFFSGRTDNSGIIDDIQLPAPPRAQPTIQNVSGPHAIYAVRSTRPGFAAQVMEADIYSGIKTIVPVSFLPGEVNG